MSESPNETGHYDQTLPPPYFADLDPPPAYQELACELPPPYIEPPRPESPLREPSNRDAVLAFFLGEDGDTDLRQPLEPATVRQPAEPSDPAIAVMPCLIAEVYDVGVRHQFIRKIFSIVLAHFVFIGATMAVVLTNNEIEKWVLRYTVVPFIISAPIIFIFVLIASVGCRICRRRRQSTNCIFLIVYGLSLTFFITVYAIMMQGKNHNTLVQGTLIGSGIISGSCLIILLLSYQTRYDLSNRFSIIALIVFLVSIFACIVMSLAFYLALRGHLLLQVIYFGIPALLYVAWLTIDTRMFWMNRDDARVDALRSDEYIHAAFDLLTLFRLLRRIVAKDVLVSIV